MHNPSSIIYSGKHFKLTKIQRSNLDSRSLQDFFRRCRLASCWGMYRTQWMSYHRPSRKEQRNSLRHGTHYLINYSICQLILHIYRKTLNRKESSLSRANRMRRKQRGKEVVGALFIDFNILIHRQHRFGNHLEHVAAWVGFGDYEDILKTKILNLSMVTCAILVQEAFDMSFAYSSAIPRTAETFWLTHQKAPHTSLIWEFMAQWQPQR